MRELKVDLGELELAFSSDGDLMSAYFDTETGETHFIEAGLLSRGATRVCGSLSQVRYANL